MNLLVCELTKETSTVTLPVVEADVEGPSNDSKDQAQGHDISNRARDDRHVPPLFLVNPLSLDSEGSLNMALPHYP